MNNNLKIGMDYSLTKKTMLGIVVSGFYNPENEAGNNISYLTGSCVKNRFDCSVIQFLKGDLEKWKREPEYAASIRLDRSGINC